MKIAFFGDIVGNTGINGVSDYIMDKSYDFIIVNGENANDTHGTTVDNYISIIKSGVDCVTSGNHFFETDDIWKYDTQCPNVIRPANLTGKIPGVGTKQFIVKNMRIRVTNLIGKAFIRQESSNMFDVLEMILADDNSDIHVIDLHAEAAYEKRALAEYFDGRVSAVLGTHTHVQTNDLQILKKGTLFITDVGMNGPYDSVIGYDTNACINKNYNNPNTELIISESKVVQINGIVFTVDDIEQKITSYEIINEIIT